MATDPICDMDVDPATSSLHHSHDGTTYWSCSDWCLNKFREDPAAALERARARSALTADTATPPAPAAATQTSAAEHFCPMCPGVTSRGPSTCPKCGMALQPVEPAAASTRTEYVCPMHPEVVRAAPGACPICGMALEPRTVATGAEPSAELVAMTRRLRLSAVLTVPVFAIAMGEMVPGLHHALSASIARFAQLVLATPVVLWGGWPFFERAWLSLRHRSANMFTLIAIGSGAAFGSSVAALLAPGLFPASFREHGGAVPIYFESAAVITTLVLVGQVLELRARERTGTAIRALLALAPPVARRIDDGGDEADVPLAEVRVGDFLRVRPGERVPVDGVVVEGRSAVDESMMSGEPVPVDKTRGEPVTGGTLNGTGGLVIRAERVGSDTLLARIVTLVADAQRSRAPIQSIADRVSSVFVPAVVAIAVLTFVAWALAGPEPRLAHALVSAVAVLIVACPCALGLATSMSIMVGVGRGASAGVLVRSAEALERLERVDTLVIDKTGTLTEGKPRVAHVVAAPGASEERLLATAAALETASEHVLAAAIVAAARERSFAIPTATEFAAKPGLGVEGIVDGERALAGDERIVMASGRPDESLVQRAAELRASGHTVVFVARAGVALGFVALADPVKATAREALAALTASGLDVVMLTGDRRANAEVVARSLGIQRVEAEVSPERKGDVVTRLRGEGRVVAMAGDGINDAPALAAADVGIAMGTGTDVAIQSAGVTLVKGDLRGIVRARRLSQGTMRNIRQNLFFAFAYNAVGIPIAAGVLYPLLGWTASPMLAAAAMSLSSVSVISNALRLRAIAL